MKIERKGTIVELTVKEFQLLEYFLRHPGQVLTRSQLEQTIWEWGTEPESNAISTLVRRVRNRLKKVDAQDWIETVYGKGYRLLMPKEIN